MTCPKKDTCLNYNIKCDSCRANSDIYNHYPLYKDRDLVEVVRCKECKHRYDPARCALWYATMNGTEYFAERGKDFYCSYGERRKE